MRILIGLYCFCCSSVICAQTLRVDSTVSDYTYDELIEWVSTNLEDKNDIAEYFYYWMASNIQYDYELVNGRSTIYGAISGQQALEVYRSGKAICAGYSDLYKLFLNEFDIECEIITGVVKRKEGLLISDSIDISHSWNAFQVDNEWFLVDVTWANTTRVNDRTSSFYFQTPPDLFVINHFPDFPQWQLLEQPIDKDNFNAMPEVNLGYYDLGFDNHMPRLVRKDSAYKLIIGVSKRWKPIVNLSSSGVEYEKVEFKRKRYKDYQELIFTVDNPGPFILRLDATKPKDWQHFTERTGLAYVVMFDPS